MARTRRPDATLIFDDTERCPDLFWRTRFAAHDPILFLERNGRRTLVPSDLELGRAREDADVHGVVPLSRYLRRLRRRSGNGASPKMADVIAEICRERKIASLLVPGRSRADLVADLRERGLKVTLGRDPFYPERVRKDEREIAAIRRAVEATEAALRVGVDLIASAAIRRGFLYAGGARLTSERVRAAIDGHLLEAGCLAQDTIVAGGEHAIDPHNRGSGPLLAHRPIILDVFPRDTESGYYADMTRTVVRGRPSPRVREMYAAVDDACAHAFGEIRDGASGMAIHRGIEAIFEARGFETGPAGDKMQGFFHGTGHGVGLEIHEEPRIGKTRDDTLRAGHVVTVEPGLYYPGVGGVRIEDLVVVREDRCENLNRFEKRLVV